ncbi:unnamed protein product [Rotaria magnacalcarata]|uniref:Ras-GEF domain-containing protein n=1 Tax=Rotaria magnacalcarata TaxID=392030 RepID=A0A819LPY7_9BILA|nr:unnamed protein product [Rotaria magnacalcarata]
MYGNIDSRSSTNGYYTGNAPIYRNNYTSSFTPNTSNIYFRHSYSPADHENIHLEENQKSNTLNRNRPYITNFQQSHRKQCSYIEEHGFENGESSSSSSSIAYYNRVYAQVHSNTPTSQHQNLSIPSIISKHSRPASPQSQSPILSLVPIVNPSASNSLKDDDDDPSLDYLHYTMDSLIQRLVPTDTYIPKQSFIYPMLLCSRMHIQPSILLNKLGSLTLSSIKHLTHDRAIRILKNFLYVLSQWTRTFPYDFRNTDTITQLEDIFKKLHSSEPNLQSETHYIHKKLLSKLKALENYEEYIRQINTKALNNISRMALITDIINECPTPVIFAQQLTHIELDRLKPIGAEELIQYFIMNLSSGEARAHPNRTFNSQTAKSSNNKSLERVHDKKLTFCLETYVQWFDRLTFFVTTEIVKHTHRRLRLRLINYFIDAAYECLRLHNFNSMIGIIGLI